MAAVIERVKHWIFVKGKNCRRCCIWCEFYERCKEDFKKEKEGGRSYEIHKETGNN